MPPVIYPEPGERLPALVRRTLAALPADQRHRVTVVTGGTRYGLDVPPGAPSVPGADGPGPETAAPSIPEGSGQHAPPDASEPQLAEGLSADADDETPVDALTVPDPTPRKTSSGKRRRTKE
ncbi:hypothetical protein ACFV5N_00870 [Streptomyces sp. NPDC059853]|uniref:hypothetical protein n=1 Tax=Streptomyces TaxID=1883 RepID=UPI00365A5785